MKWFITWNLTILVLLNSEHVKGEASRMGDYVPIEGPSYCQFGVNISISENKYSQTPSLVRTELVANDIAQFSNTLQ